MEKELKGALQQAAVMHGRTLTKEINTRLRESLTPPMRAQSSVAEDVAEKKVLQLGHTAASVHISAVSNLDQAMLGIFRAMPVEKQLALLSLFK
jgi:hypothetical protein